IIGGGYTGLSTALHGAARGLNCHVVEAEVIGHGGSGRNAGLVNAGLWLPPQDVRARMGEARGAALVDLLGGGPDYVFSLIEKHQMRCEAVRAGTIHAAHAPSGLRDLERRAGEWKRLGVPVRLLTPDEATERIGTPAFCGGLFDPRAGTINPMGYARGLARAARDAGARITTGVTAQSLRRETGGWLVGTTQGTIRAKAVVIGTNAYSGDLWPGLRDSFTIIRYFQLATEPLGERGAAILPGGEGIWDTGTIMFSLRRDGYGRLIIGSMGEVIGGLSERWARAKLRRLFPALGPVQFEAGWHGQIAMTPDHLPRIHRLAEGVYTPVGYNGRGISPGTMFGKALAELLAGGREDALPMPVTDLRPIRAGRLQSAFFRAVFAANQALRSF
ncbi:MAG: FAD-binding oxidoreductase, partial [Rhodobacteraceae bacterium]|nr:FAD-binding oxidoreductase [Paracoccaceae bacterium]